VPGVLFDPAANLVCGLSAMVRLESVHSARGQFVRVGGGHGLFQLHSLLWKRTRRICRERRQRLPGMMVYCLLRNGLMTSRTAFDGAVQRRILTYIVIVSYLKSSQRVTIFAVAAIHPQGDDDRLRRRMDGRDSVSCEISICWAAIAP
jgi:hypothetical protein